MVKCAECEAPVEEPASCLACDAPLCERDRIPMERANDPSVRGVACPTCSAELQTQGYKLIPSA